MKRKIMSIFICLTLIVTIVPVNSSAAGDFEIRDGVLVKYNGPGGAVAIPNDVTKIGNEAFYNCVNLTSVSIPSSVTSIDLNAFRGCTNLTSVSIPSSVTNIGMQAFLDCTRLTSINISSGVTSIGDQAFRGCISLISVIMPDSVTSIAINAFFYANSSMIFYCPSGSYALKYAQENGITYVIGSPDYSRKNNPSVTTIQAAGALGSTENQYLDVCASVPCLQTVINSDGGISVLDTDNAVVYEFSTSMEYIKTQSFHKELDQIGAFTKDADGNYYIFYGKAVDKSAEDECNLVLVKYSPEGRKLKEYLTQRNAMTPFYGGTCKMEISGDVIAVRFAKQRFDGHQDSGYLFLRTDTLEPFIYAENESGRAWNVPSVSFVSHSFNQFILPVEGGFMFVDHGDGNPRAFAFDLIDDLNHDFYEIGYQRGKRYATSFEFYNSNPNFLFAQGYNKTYAEMGGVAETSYGFLFVGTYEENRTSGFVSTPRDIFLLAINSPGIEYAEDYGDDVYLEVSAPIWITNYNDDQNAVSPKIVRIDDAKYLLLWENYNNRRTMTYMTIVDENGNIIESIKPILGVQLNGCDVLRYNPATGLVHWAVSTGDGMVRLYALDPYAETHYAPPAAQAPTTANQTSATVLVNGKQVAFDAYNISGNNYFKLRDLAYILSGTAKQFEVSWDGANNAISLTSGQPYTSVGGEMTGKGSGDKTPTATTSKILLDGKEVAFTAYTIEGNNYFKLRDIGQAFDFGVDWDGANNTIVIDTSKGYTPD